MNEWFTKAKQTPHKACSATCWYGDGEDEGSVTRTREGEGVRHEIKLAHQIHVRSENLEVIGRHRIRPESGVGLGYR